MFNNAFNRKLCYEQLCLSFALRAVDDFTDSNVWRWKK